MAKQGEQPVQRNVRASIGLTHQVVDGKDLFTLPATLGVPGPCDNKGDGASCGLGCTCKGGQPWYSTDAIAELGFKIEDPLIK